MKRKCFQLTKRIIAVCLAAGMAVGMTACSSSGGSSKSDSAASGVKATGAYAGLDISTPVTLTFYNLGDVPTDMEKVQKEANEKYFQEHAPFRKGTLHSLVFLTNQRKSTANHL